MSEGPKRAGLLAGLIAEARPYKSDGSVAVAGSSNDCTGAGAITISGQRAALLAAGVRRVWWQSNPCAPGRRDRLVGPRRPGRAARSQSRALRPDLRRSMPCGVVAGTRDRGPCARPSVRRPPPRPPHTAAAGSSGSSRGRRLSPTRHCCRSPSGSRAGLSLSGSAPPARRPPARTDSGGSRTTPATPGCASRPSAATRRPGPSACARWRRRRRTSARPDGWSAPPLPTA